MSVRREGWKLLVLLTVALLPGTGAAQSDPLPPEARQFDFWLGGWDVNLRTHQTDLEWRDTYASKAEIYPILAGKAVLELWDERNIKGFSLRHFDVGSGEWVLWLNWPGENRSGSSSLSGSFRHGRGEFYSTRTMDDGTEMISRYSFSDITPTSLRWDDAFSRDGGNTWTHNWIMEFSRTAETVRLPAEGGEAHTFVDGGRCTLPQFRDYEFLSGRRKGTMEVGGSGEVVMTGYRVLDGCAVFVFVGETGDPEQAMGFGHLTWNTYAGRYELLGLAADPASPARVFFGTREGDALVFTKREADGGDERVRISRVADGAVDWRHELRADGEWRLAWAARFGG